MADTARQRLSDLKDELARLAADPWSNMESWTAKARSIIRRDWPDDLDYFDELTKTPRFCVSLSTFMDGRESPRNTEANRSLAEKAKERILSFLDGLLLSSTDTQLEILQTGIEARKVFVVYGRNTAARDAVFAFLRAIDLHPLEWPEVVKATRDASPYIGQVLETGFRIVQAVLVLMTPDDEARLREPFRGADEPRDETELTPQPRPNVLFEAGMALGLFPERTVIVEFGRLRQVSDLLGRHTVRMDGSSEKREELAQRLETAGCAVNRSGTDWYKAGDFGAALACCERTA